MDFYEAIGELNINLENRLFTVCSGAHAGEKMIVSSGEPVWMSDEDGFFACHQSEAASAADGCVTVMGGEKVFAELLGNEKKMVMAIVSEDQYQQVKEIIDKHDPNAFVIISEAKDVNGEGFTYEPRI